MRSEERDVNRDKHACVCVSWNSGVLGRLRTERRTSERPGPLHTQRDNSPLNRSQTGHQSPTVPDLYSDFEDSSAPKPISTPHRVRRRSGHSLRRVPRRVDLGPHPLLAPDDRLKSRTSTLPCVSHPSHRFPSPPYPFLTPGLLVETPPSLPPKLRISSEKTSS